VKWAGRCVALRSRQSLKTVKRGRHGRVLYVFIVFSDAFLLSSSAACCLSRALAVLCLICAAEECYLDDGMWKFEEGAGLRCLVPESGVPELTETDD